MTKIRTLAAVALAGTALAGCIMLPPPPAPLHAMPPPPGDAMPPLAHHGPPPGAFELCVGKAEGERFEMPGRRADMLAGTCERGPDGRLVPRPDGAR
jgi:hypothetical protein